MDTAAVAIAAALLLLNALTVRALFAYLRDRDERDRGERRELAERIQRPELVPTLPPPAEVLEKPYLSEDEEDQLWLQRNLDAGAAE